MPWLLLAFAGVLGQADATEIQSLLATAAEAMTAGELDRAEAELERARDLAPEAPEALIGLSEIRAQRGRLFDALELAEQARALAPRDARAAAWSGRLLARVGAYPRAIEALAEARRFGPVAPPDVVLAAMLLAEVDRRDEAIALLEAQGRAASAEVAAQLGVLLLEAGRVSEARRATREALEAGLSAPELDLAHGLASAADPEGHADAVEPLRRALASGVPGSDRAQLELGRVLLELGRAQEALEPLRASAAQQPQTPEVHYRLARALQAVGQRDEARTVLQRFQEASRASDAADWGAKEERTAFNEAQALALSNQLHSALSRLDELIARDPGLARAHALRAKVLSSLQRDTEALASISRALELEAHVVEYHYLQGLFLVGLGEPEQGAASLRRALLLDPDLADAHRLLGLVAVNAERFGEACEHLDRAVSLGSDDPELRRQLAIARGAGCRQTG